MVNEQTIQKMQQMKLYQMADKFQSLSSNPQYRNISLQEGLAYLIDAEYTGRENRKRIRLLQQAQLKYQAHLEEIDYHTHRGLDKTIMLELSEQRWQSNHQNILISGPTGIGKSYLACALGYKCCENGISAYYIRIPKLLHEINQNKAMGNYLNYLKKLTRFDVLIIDDLGLTGLNKKESADLLDIVEDRYQTSSLVINSQLPFEDWYQLFSDQTIADAICDRLFHHAYKIHLKGESMRKKTASPKQQNQNESETKSE